MGILHTDVLLELRGLRLRLRCVLLLHRLQAVADEPLLVQEHDFQRFLGIGVANLRVPGSR